MVGAGALPPLRGAFVLTDKPGGSAALRPPATGFDPCGIANCGHGMVSMTDPQAWPFAGRLPVRYGKRREPPTNCK